MVEAEPRQLPGRLRGHVHRGLFDHRQFDGQTVFLEVAQVLGEVQGAVADPRGVADGQGAGLGAGGDRRGDGGDRQWMSEAGHKDLIMEHSRSC